MTTPQTPPAKGTDCSSGEQLAYELERLRCDVGLLVGREQQKSLGDLATLLCKHTDEIIAALRTPSPQINKPDTNGLGDWPEDLAHENGNYECVCAECGRHFQGHKRRGICRACALAVVDTNGLGSGVFTHEPGCPYPTAAGGLGFCTCTPEQKEIKRLKAEIQSQATTIARLREERDDKESDLLACQNTSADLADEIDALQSSRALDQSRIAKLEAALTYALSAKGNDGPSLAEAFDRLGAALKSPEQEGRKA